MEFNSKEIQAQYQGFINTNLLWNATFCDLQQIELPNISTTVFNDVICKNPRLGKRVESFASFYLKQAKGVEILIENIQIQQNNITLGELDFIINQENTLYHIELSFKFYLYDSSLGETEIERWIGPNKNDSLEKKINKLSDKQLPLLHKKETKNQLTIDTTSAQQRVFFKTQLFVPYYDIEVNFEVLNPACVSGFYVYQYELTNFSTCKFYIPSKMNWLLDPHEQVNWLSYKVFKDRIIPLLRIQKSPLSWVKFPNGQLRKFFIVWW